MQTLKEEHFVDNAREETTNKNDNSTKEKGTLCKTEGDSCDTATVEKEDEVAQVPTASITDTSTVDIENPPENQSKDQSGNPYGEDESIQIRIPLPGLNYDFNKKDRCQAESRLASGLCTICLSVFVPGSDIVWSSNYSCEHVFHAECIERWLMKQREGPLCPCCRRDFIVDPYDLEESTNNNLHVVAESDDDDDWIQPTFSGESTIDEVTGND